MAAILDTFIPNPDAGGRHEIVIDAPAELVLETAWEFDIQSIPAIRAIFWLRGAILGTKNPVAPRTDLIADMLGRGWGPLAEDPGHFFAAGAACRPWLADVVFSPIPPDRFAAYDEPDRVKIAWTIEVDPLGPGRSRFATETRAVATDARARALFRRYWFVFSIGILAIRKLLLRAVRREAQRKWQQKRENLVHSPS